MLLALSVLNIRRATYFVLLVVSVLGIAMSAGRLVIEAIPPSLAVPGFLCGFISLPLLCVWCAVYVRDEPNLARIAFIWIAVLCIFLFTALLMARPAI